MLFVLGTLMLASGHAVQVTHLHHHRHCLDDEDVESWPAKLRWWRVILLGPLFPVTLHRAAWRLGTRGKRAWIAVELLAIAVLITAAVVIPALHAVRWHLLAMIAGEWLVGFFAVWTVHHDCDAHEHIARTQRGWFKNFMTYSMLYHIEHHLYPAVPTCKLQALAARLDMAAPEVRTRQVY